MEAWIYTVIAAVFIVLLILFVAYLAQKTEDNENSENARWNVEVQTQTQQSSNVLSFLPSDNDVEDVEPEPIFQHGKPMHLKRVHSNEIILSIPEPPS